MVTTKMDIFYFNFRDQLRRLDFYQDEIGILEKELSLVIEQFPNRMAMIEHVEEYCDIFDRKLKNLSTLKTKLKNLEQVYMQNIISPDDLQKGQEKISEEVDAFVHDMELLKKNFRRFVARNMHSK